MKRFQHVTFTGADNSCNPEELLVLSRHYLFIEWGILISKSRMGTPRFPSLAWINRLQEVFKGTPHKLSLHLCGSMLRSLLLGSNEIPPELLEGFQRVQLNFHGEALKLDAAAFVQALNDSFSGRQIIFQIDGAMGPDFLMVAQGARRSFDCVPLFDTSHGGGVLPGEWPEVTEWDGSAYGYAGGLGPDCLEAELPRIAAAAKDAPFWIDMETKVRTQFDSTFDLNAVRSCCDIVHAYLNPPPAAAAEQAAA